MAVKNFSVKLDDVRQEIIQGKIDAGLYNSATEVIRSALDVMGDDENARNAVSTTVNLQGTFLVVTTRIDLKNL